MDIRREQFFVNGFINQEIGRNLEDCLFVSLDLEFTGIKRDAVWFDTMEERYQVLKATATRYTPIQVGVSIFSKHPEKPEKLINRTFNFTTFPPRQVDVVMCTQASRFLSRNELSFDKWIKEGIGYITRAEEAEINKKMAARQETGHEIPEKDIQPEAQAFLDHKLHEIEEWLELPHHTETEWGDGPVVFETERLNGFQRLLLHQTVRKKWPYLYVETTRPSERDSTLSVRHLGETDVEKCAKLKEDILAKRMEDRIGFRKVLDLISKSKALLVGHNMLLDLLFSYHHYVDNLPNTFTEFATAIHEYFPNVLDTKYFAFRSKFTYENTALEVLYRELKDNTPGHRPVIFGYPKDSWYSYDLYREQAQSHEAGYDSLVTGKVMANLYKREYGAPAYEISKDNPNLQPLINNLYMADSHFPCRLVAPFRNVLFRQAYYFSGKGVEDPLKVKQFSREHKLGYVAMRMQGDTLWAIFPKSDPNLDPREVVKAAKSERGWNVVPYFPPEVEPVKQDVKALLLWSAIISATVICFAVASDR